MSAVPDFANLHERAAAADEEARKRREQQQQSGGDAKGNGVKPLRGEDFADMRPRLDLAATIKGLIAPTTVNAIIGPSGSGKTFFSSGMGCHVAAGMLFYGRKTNRGLVVYCALEGGASARNRFYAWRARHLQAGQSIPLRAMIDSINLRDPVDQLRLVELIREAESSHGEKCVLVIVDTLSRAMAGGNENGPEDMGALVAGADAVRNATGAAIVLVHHLGKDEGRGARGHSLLHCALDTEIEIVVAGEQRVATVTKQRDWPEGDKFAFTLDVIELGADQDGELVTSCVILPCDAMPEPRPELRGKAQRQPAQRAPRAQHCGADMDAGHNARSRPGTRAIERHGALRCRCALTQPAHGSDRGGYRLAD